ncbi:hypothetical protein [Vibrio crassostreae]|uniref:hypothetical protein n=1 Tax=Vibrio crassostreae TaxID=246167 RepID=UPI001B30B8FE|nr:hypothetical protein [Vibrio crassostreae]
MGNPINFCCADSVVALITTMARYKLTGAIVLGVVFKFFLPTRERRVSDRVQAMASSIHHI